MSLLPGDIGFLPLVVSTSGRLNADIIRLVYLHGTKWASLSSFYHHHNTPLYNLLPGDIGSLPLVVFTSGRLNADFIRLVYLHATKESKTYLDAIDPVDAEDGHKADAAGGRRDREFLVQRSRFLAALKTRLGLILAKAVAMRVMINATGCSLPDHCPGVGS